MAAVCLMPQFLIVATNIPILFGWYIIIDCCGGCNGLYVTSAVAFDVSVSMSRLMKKSNLKRLW